MNVRFLIVVIGIMLSEPSRGEITSRGLAADRPGADVAFTPVPKASGLDFAHHWSPPAQYKGVKDRAFAGGGVAIADVTGDQRPDVCLTRPFGGTQIFRNEGEWKFTNITATSGLSGEENRWAGGATFADIDNDGDSDLFLCGFDSPNRLYLNDGQGKFTEIAQAAGLDFSGASVQMHWADFDRDGDLDGYLVTNRAQTSEKLTPEDQRRLAEIESQLRPDPQTGQYRLPEAMMEDFDIVPHPNGRPFLINAGQADHLYRNDGLGATGKPRFTNITRAAGLWDNGRGQAAIWWDYDDNGWPDLYVANDFYGPDRLWKNNGDGTFTDVAPRLLSHTPWFSMGCDSGDLNNDGWPDLFTSDMAGSTHYKDKMGMGDMDRNGWFLEVPQPRQYMRNAVFLNTGGGQPFMDIAHMIRMAATDWTWAVKLADLDCDGWLDVFVTNGMTGDFLNSDLRASGGESAGTLTDAPPKKDTNMAFRNAGSGLEFENIGNKWGLALEAVSFGAGYGDLDGDGDLDIAVNNFDQACAVYEATGISGQRLLIRLRGTTSNKDGFGARVALTCGGTTQTRWHTGARGFFGSDDPTLHFGLGKATQADKVTIHWPSGIVQTLGPLPSGQCHTITETGMAHKPYGSPHLAVEPFFQPSSLLATATHRETPYDDFALQPLLPNRLSQNGPGHAWGDVDADGDEDFFLGGGAGHPGRLYFNEGPRSDGKPQFVIKSFAPFEADAACEDMGAAFFDADGDSDLDLFVVSGGIESKTLDADIYQDRLYTNDGKGTFSRPPSPALPQEKDSGSQVAVGDFDQDGDADLAIGGRVTPGKYPLSPGSRLWCNDKGRFTEVTAELAPTLAKAARITDLAWADINRDAWPDLVAVSEWGSLQVWVSAEGKSFAPALETHGHSGWWNCLNLADLDADGDLDVIAGNFGLNTKYHPNSSQPQKLFYADFDGTGSPQIVEAKTLDDMTILPIRGKSCSQNAMPFLKGKFPTFHQFASATLTEIYTADKLNQAVQLEANTLHSSVFWNESTKGKTAFTFQPLPRLAQIAPVMDVAITDVNADGKPDLILAQNFYHPQRETGRMDGGVSLLLLNRGNREFHPVPAMESGITLQIDPRGVSTRDLNGDGQSDLIFISNDGPVKVLEKAN